MFNVFLQHGPLIVVTSIFYTFLKLASSSAQKRREITIHYINSILLKEMSFLSNIYRSNENLIVFVCYFYDSSVESLDIYNLEEFIHQFNFLLRQIR